MDYGTTMIDRSGATTAQFQLALPAQPGAQMALRSDSRPNRFLRALFRVFWDQTGPRNLDRATASLVALEGFPDPHVRWLATPRPSPDQHRSDFFLRHGGAWRS